MSLNYDVIIVGAGVAGASCAIALAREGYRILLLDKASFPRDKACGEGIMPAGVETLAELGLLPEILEHGGTPFRGMRYWNRQGVMAQADFPLTASGVQHGIVMRRYHLDYVLLQHAKLNPNIVVREGFRVTQVLKEQQRVAGVAGHPLNGRSRPERFSAPLTIGADGHNSIFHAACGLTKRYGTRRRYGVTGHLRGVDDTGSYVEVLSHSDGEIYIAPCDEGVSLVALLLEKRAMRSFNGGLSIGYLNFLDGFDRFRGRSAKIELVSPVLAAGPLGFTVEPCHRPGLLLMGDSAGFLDPITGEGMTLALRSVGAAVPLIRDAFACGEFGLRLGQRYAAQRLRLSDDVARFTQLLLTLSRYKFIADRAVSRLSRDRRLFEKLLGIVAGRHKYRDLSLHDKFLLLMG